MQLRTYFAIVLAGIFAASFAAHLWLFYWYIAHRPAMPRPDLGLVYPLSNHGTYYYLSAVESEELALLFWCAFVAIMLLFIVVPKKFLPPPAQIPRWIGWVSVAFKTGLEDLSRRDCLILGASFLLCLTLIVLAGHGMAQLALSFGM